MNAVYAVNAVPFSMNAVFIEHDVSTNFEIRQEIPLVLH